MAKRVATVEDFDRLKNDTGLVAMEFLVPTITERVGDIRGAEPYTALRWYNDGIAEPLDGLAERPVPAQRAGSEGDAARGSAVEIPEAWRDTYHLQRIALAKKISGNEGKLTVEQADEIISAEVTRRAAANAAGPNALTTQQTVTG